MPRVTVYTLPTCADCQQLKRFLAENDVPFDERDASQDSVRDEMVRLYDRRMSPTIIIDGEVITGFARNKAQIEKLLGIS